MPELPEVDAIAGVARRHAVDNEIVRIEVDRWNGKYFSTSAGPVMGPHPVAGGWNVKGVYRVGKQVLFELRSNLAPSYIVVHNAMTGFFDWDHEPWTFDYVEGRRTSTDSDVRVRFHFRDGKVLRFHDARLFGSMHLVPTVPSENVPELMDTPNGMPGRPIITSKQFFEGLSCRTPIKVRLMDQSFVGGIGNIYASEGCNLAGIDPRRKSNSLSREESDVLLEALRLSVSNCIPQVRYDWLNVYRRSLCRCCGFSVERIKLGGRATFFCTNCQVP
jgi:formamidopyrimidine-DNA glycosylase